MMIIGIAGGTGSGKTTVVKKIVESLPEGSVAVIPPSDEAIYYVSLKTRGVKVLLTQKEAFQMFLL